MEPTELERRLVTVYQFVCIYFIAAAILASASLRGLVADGSAMLLTTMERQAFPTFEPGRYFGHMLTLWPVIALLKAGVTERSLLFHAHSFGLFYIGPLALVLCYAYVPRHCRSLLLWPLLSLSTASMHVWLFAAAETNVLTPIFWPLALYLLVGRLEQRGRLLVFLVLAFLSLLVYETMVWYGLVLAVLALSRARRAGRGAERVLWIALAVWFLLAAGIALWSIINPHLPANRTALIASLLGPFRWGRKGSLNVALFFSLAGLGMVAVVLAVSRLPVRVYHGMLGLLAVLGGYVAVSPLLMHDSLQMTRAYNSRASASFVACALAVVMIGLHFLKVSLPADGLRRAFGIAGVLSASLLTWQNVASAQWHGYLQIVSAELRTHRGLLAFEDSVVSQQPPGTQIVSNLTWDWTTPVLSLLLARDGKVTTIIGPAKGVGYVAFDPKNPASLPPLQRYGYDYDRYVEALKGR